MNLAQQAYESGEMLRLFNLLTYGRALAGVAVVPDEVVRHP